MVYTYASSKDVYSGRKEELLKAASEGGLEITVKGFCEPSMAFPVLYIEEVIVDGRSLPRNLTFNSED